MFNQWVLIDPIHMLVGDSIIRLIPPIVLLYSKFLFSKILCQISSSERLTSRIGGVSNQVGPRVEDMQKHPFTSFVSNSTASSVFDLPVQNLDPPQQNKISAPATSGIRNASVIVVSGGTGCNSLCPAFGQDACYVLPVSDDGGSSSEIIRVIGSLTLLALVV